MPTCHVLTVRNYMRLYITIVPVGNHILLWGGEVAGIENTVINSKYFGLWITRSAVG